MVGIELVADRETREPFPRAAGVTEAVVRAARERGVLVYSGTGCANGVDGDTILLGPPFVVTDGELERIVAVLAESIEVVGDAGRLTIASCGQGLATARLLSRTTSSGRSSVDGDVTPAAAWRA